MRIVIDTNLYISALINNSSRQRLNIILENATIEILLDDALLTEIYTVAHRPKFAKYVSIIQINAFIELLLERCTFVETSTVVQASPDPKDDFLLALCLDNQADYLLTGNKKDLLDLQFFGHTQIVSLSDFLVLEQ